MSQVVIDAIDRKILKYLITNARMPFLEIARKCGISGAAIHQRIKKLDESGVILGSRLVVDPKMLGFDVCAYIGIRLQDVSILMAQTDSRNRGVPFHHGDVQPFREIVLRRQRAPDDDALRPDSGHSGHFDHTDLHLAERSVPASDLRRLPPRLTAARRTEVRSGRFGVRSV